MVYPPPKPAPDAYTAPEGSPSSQTSVSPVGGGLAGYASSAPQPSTLSAQRLASVTPAGVPSNLASYGAAAGAPGTVRPSPAGGTVQTDRPSGRIAPRLSDFSSGAAAAGSASGGPPPVSASASHRDLPPDFELDD